MHRWNPLVSEKNNAEMLTRRVVRTSVFVNRDTSEPIFNHSESSSSSTSASSSSMSASELSAWLVVTSVSSIPNTSNRLVLSRFFSKVFTCYACQIRLESNPLSKQKCSSQRQTSYHIKKHKMNQIFFTSISGCIAVANNLRVLRFTVICQKSRSRSGLSPKSNKVFSTLEKSSHH